MFINLQIKKIFPENPKNSRVIAEPYYRIKESYRDRLDRVHSLVLLSPGFIKGYSGKELNLTSKALNKLMLHKGESATLFGDILSEYPERVASLAREYWSQMVAKGTVDTFRERKFRNEISHQGRLLLRSDTLEHKEGRDLGAEWLCLQAIRQLVLDAFLHAQGWSEDKVLFTLAHLITRTVYTPSELKSMRIIQENSAVADILGLDRDKLKKHNIYAVAPALYSLKGQLDSYLARKTDSLFGLTNRIFLFDLTNFYFESPKRSSRKARFGRSKEKRYDCKLLVLALCVNTAGFIRYSAVLEGNASDPQTLPAMIEELAKMNPTAGTDSDKALVVIDAGISSEDNLALIKEKGGKSYRTEIVRTMSTQKLVRSNATNALGETVEMDICTQPTQAAAAIYDKLGFRHYPFRKMKICSAQT